MSDAGRRAAAEYLAANGVGSGDVVVGLHLTFSETARGWLARGSGRLHRHETRRFAMTIDETRPISVVAPEEFSDEVAALNTLAIEVVADRRARIMPLASGLPDDLFENDNQITKREVRAATLAILGPSPDRLLWDVGAGCGSVSIEWIDSAFQPLLISPGKPPAAASA